MTQKLKIVDDVECPFTPGPWVVKEGLAFPFWVDAPKSGRSICEVDKPGVVPDAPHPHTRGNAHLIAAAPDMLEALETILPHVQVKILGKSLPYGKESPVGKVIAAIKAARP